MTSEGERTHSSSKYMYIGTFLRFFDIVIRELRFEGGLSCGGLDSSRASCGDFDGRTGLLSSQILGLTLIQGGGQE